MSNHEKLKTLVIDTFLLDETEYHVGLRREDVDTVDSLGVVSLAVGINETFGYHFTPREATAIDGVADIIALLEARGISFDE